MSQKGVEARDQWARRFISAIPELARAIGGQERYGSLLAELRRDRVLLWRGRRLHLEIYGHAASAPTLVFHHGYGAYSALYAPCLALLASRGINVVALDRPGHGLSDGRRGDCTVGELADVTRLVVTTVAQATGRPIALFGTSAGGMLTSCLIPYLDDVVDGYICHGVHNPTYARAKIGSLLGKCADALPVARFPYRLIPRRIRRGISTNPVVRDWFHPRRDPLATLDQTLRSVLSMTIAYRPPKAPSEVRRPVLALVGTDDTMLPLSSMIRSLERMDLQQLETHMVVGGHMLLHEQSRDVVDAVSAWVGALSSSSAD